MPHLSGRELLDRLQSRLGDLPVVFMSGYSIEAVERHGVLREGASLLRKPFTPQEFLAAVSAALTGASARGGPGGVA
jgi:FixJ family two-component response regulator